MSSDNLLNLIGCFFIYIIEPDTRGVTPLRHNWSRLSYIREVF